LSVENIEKVLSQADEVDIREGKMAYQNYHDLMRRIAEHYQVGFVQTVAAFVALSPNNDYVGNLRSLVTVAKRVQDRLPIPEEGLRTSSYGHCVARAYQYLTGEEDFWFRTKGPKIRSFYINILLPQDNRFVTIDGHMYNAWSGGLTPLKQIARAGFSYNEIVKDFKIVARRQNLIPCQVQAIVWFAWKRINNIVYEPQLSLFGDKEDCWGLKLKPEEIRSYM
jgi:hypothetical protein